ncbi:MAG: lipid A biosynthesis acyltransferase [Flavobacteriaceae bacterium]|nr:lipid A biosynthesis acyltransferase [Flavobacteriaceae bacterium]
MQLLIFILVYPIIWFLSILPMRILFAFSDLLYFVVYYIIGYRKKVVRYNLKLSFPNKSKQERLEIEKKTIQHFLDTFMEMIKSFSISEKEISKRFVYKNTAILDDLYKQNKSLVIMAGHYANWEWVVNVSSVVPYKGYAAYKKVKNKYFENKVKTSRTRFGANFIPTSEFMNIMKIHKDEHILAIYGLLSDQSPKLSKTHYWSNFMGVNVPVHTGAEMLAKKYNYPVVYFKTERIRRGYYESTVEVLAENPQDFKNYEITDIFLQKLENQIRNNPEYYFWTHNRFKHMKSK